MIEQHARIYYTVTCDRCQRWHPAEFSERPYEEMVNGYEDESKADPAGYWEVRTYSDKRRAPTVYCYDCKEIVWKEEEQEFDRDRARAR